MTTQSSISRIRTGFTRAKRAKPRRAGEEAGERETLRNFGGVGDYYVADNVIIPGVFTRHSVPLGRFRAGRYLFHANPPASFFKNAFTCVVSISPVLNERAARCSSPHAHAPTFPGMLSREENSRARTRIFRTNKYSLDKISPRRRTVSVEFPWPASSPNSDAPRLTVRASGGGDAAWEKSSFGFHYFARAITRRHSRLVKMSPGTFAINIPGRNAESPMSLGQFNFVPPMCPSPSSPFRRSPFLARFIKRPDRERGTTRGSVPRIRRITRISVYVYTLTGACLCLIHEIEINYVPPLTYIFGYPDPGERERLDIEPLNWEFN